MSGPRPPSHSLTGAALQAWRKTLTIRRRRAPGDMPPFRVSVLLPERWLVAPGDTGITGVKVEIEQISGALAVAEHRDLEWACRQLGKFLLRIATGTERILTAVVTRDGVQQSQQIVVGPDTVEFPRRGRTTWQVAS
jgi:hypothetical protein